MRATAHSFMNPRLENMARNCKFLLLPHDTSRHMNLTRKKHEVSFDFRLLKLTALSRNGVSDSLPFLSRENHVEFPHLNIPGLFAFILN
jgi:hypothetical protein